MTSNCQWVSKIYYFHEEKKLENLWSSFWKERQREGTSGHCGARAFFCRSYNKILPCCNYLFGYNPVIHQHNFFRFFFKIFQIIKVLLDTSEKTVKIITENYFIFFVRGFNFHCFYIKSQPQMEQKKKINPIFIKLGM